MNRKLLYLPDICPGAFVLFFHKGDARTSTSFSIRDYSQPPTAEMSGRSHFPGTTAGYILGKAKFSYDVTSHKVTDDVFWKKHISEANLRHGLKPLIAAGGVAEKAPQSRDKEISIDMADLKRSYERCMEDAPRRHDRQKFYFVDGHDGIPSTGSGTNREEEHLAIALWNRFGPAQKPLQLPDGISLTLLDYQFPLKARQDDKGVGKIDLFGVTAAGQAWVIELKQGGNRTDLPSAALVQALRYAAMAQANMDGIRSEPKGRSIRNSIPAVCVMAPEGYWSGQLGGLEGLRKQIETELAVPVHFVAIKMSPTALTKGLNGKRPTLNGDVRFDYVEVD